MYLVRCTEIRQRAGAAAMVGSAYGIFHHCDGFRVGYIPPGHHAEPLCGDPVLGGCCLYFVDGMEYATVCRRYTRCHRPELPKWNAGNADECEDGGVLRDRTGFLCVALHAFVLETVGGWVVFAFHSTRGQSGVAVRRSIFEEAVGEPPPGGRYHDGGGLGNVRRQPGVAPLIKGLHQRYF